MLLLLVLLGCLLYNYIPPQLLTCARSQSLVDFLVQRARFHGDSGGDPESVAPEHIFVMLHSNPEPAVLMALPQEEGWPFPRYFGACGRVAAFEVSFFFHLPDLNFNKLTFPTSTPATP